MEVFLWFIKILKKRKGVPLLFWKKPKKNLALRAKIFKKFLLRRVFFFLYRFSKCSGFTVGEFYGGGLILNIRILLFENKYWNMHSCRIYNLIWFFCKNILYFSKSEKIKRSILPLQFPPPTARNTRMIVRGCLRELKRLILWFSPLYKPPSNEYMIWHREVFVFPLVISNG